MHAGGSPAAPYQPPLTRREAERLLERMLATLPEDAAEFRRLCGEVTDWDMLLGSAHGHGVAGVLHHHLTASGYPLPAEVKLRADRQRVFEQLAQSPLHDALDEALTALDAANLRAVALKGPVLAERLYPDPSLRLSVDLDLLVRPADLDCAIAALGSIGYTSETGPADRYYRRHHHHIHLYRPHSPMIELHFRLYAGFGTVLAAEPFLSRAIAYRTARRGTVWILAPEDEFLYLALHAAGHGCLYLSWLYELKLLLRQHPELDWSAVEEKACASGIASAVAFTLGMLGRLHVPVHVPNGVVPALRQRLASAFRGIIVTRPQSRPVQTLGMLAFSAALCDRPASAIRLLGHGLGRITRRRLRRLLPGLTPDEWSA